MSGLLRFSDYDVFAYVACGIAVFVLCDLLLATQLVVNAQWSISDGVLAIASAYVVGHVTAVPSGWVIERQLVRRWLGRPGDALLGETSTSGLRAFLARNLLSDFYTPLEGSIAGRLKGVMASEELRSGEALFWRAYPIAKAEPVAYARMETFLKLYGFSRNLAFVGLSGGVILSLSAGSIAVHGGHGAGLRLLHAVLALLLGLSLLHRYLKFYRLFAVEVLTTFDAKRRDAE